MIRDRLSAYAPTPLFVLLWSSGAIACEIGLHHASPFALLLVRYALALLTLVLLIIGRHPLLPAPGTRLRVAVTGLLMAGVYSSFYILALDSGVTPGVLAIILGIQPIVTALLTERRTGPLRLAGLGVALSGLALVVLDGFEAARFDALGMTFAGLSLLGVTAGSIIQKGENQPPLAVLPLQYLVGFAFIVTLAPFMPLDAKWDWPFFAIVFWLGVITSVGGFLLLYGLIARGNLVNVTSLLYFVPGVTAALDWLLLGHAMSLQAIAGLGLVTGGVVLVFAGRERQVSASGPSASLRGESQGS